MLELLLLENIGRLAPWRRILIKDGFGNFIYNFKFFFNFLFVGWASDYKLFEGRDYLVLLFVNPMFSTVLDT